jgi:hypothetical protein
MLYGALCADRTYGDTDDYLKTMYSMEDLEAVIDAKFVFFGQFLEMICKEPYYEDAKKKILATKYSS